MKSSDDPRHLKRIKMFKRLYALSFTGKKYQEEVDQIISAHAPDWPINKLNKVDLAILRLAVSEIKSGQAPVKVVIDEAIELAKKFGTEKTPKFINGVLNAVIEND